MTDSRTANRPKIGSTVALRRISPTNVTTPTVEAEDELAADPLAEDPLDDPDDGPGVGPPRVAAATRRTRPTSAGRSLSR